MQWRIMSTESSPAVCKQKCGQLEWGGATAEAYVEVMLRR